MKKLLFLLFAVIFCIFSVVLAETDKEKAEKEFKELKASFEEEVSYPPYSDYVYKTKYWMSPSGKAIIAMGKRALPFIMDEIKAGNYWYTYAASGITGLIMPGTTGGDLSEKWLAWWDENKDDPQWNLFIEGKPQGEQGPTVGLNENNNY